VARKCAAADPRHGELWCVVSKDLANAGLKPEDVLLKAAAAITGPFEK
jgi:pre-mRNA-processing factor 6